MRRAHKRDMKCFRPPARTGPGRVEDVGQRMMLRCAGGYLFASALAAALGFAGLGRFSIAAVVFLLLTAALLLAAGLFCSALGTLADENLTASTPRPRRRA